MNTKNLLLLFAILLLQFNAFAVGGEKCDAPISVNTEAFITPKKGIFHKLKSRILKKKIDNLLHQLSNTKCDRIIFHNGEEIEVTIVDIVKGTVTFKECGAEGPAIDSLDCSDVEIIFRTDDTEYICAHPSLPRRSSKANFMLINEVDNRASSKTTHFCDLLILINKDQLEVEIVELKQKEVVYKNCDSEGGLTSIPNTEIRTIRHRDGRSIRVNYYENEENVHSRMLQGMGKALLIVLLGIVLLTLLLVVLFQALFF